MRLPGSNKKRTRLPSVSTNATILVVTLPGKCGQAAGTKRPAPQTDVRSFKPPFLKLETEISRNGKPE
jgi:hypothetical protein